MAKEKCDAFKYKKLYLDRSEEKEEDYDWIVLKATEDGRLF